MLSLTKSLMIQILLCHLKVFQLNLCLMVRYCCKMCSAFWEIDYKSCVYVSKLHPEYWSYVLLWLCSTDSRQLKFLKESSIPEASLIHLCYIIRKIWKLVFCSWTVLYLFRLIKVSIDLSSQIIIRVKLIMKNIN